ncbi:cytosolic phospholipase A2 gamma-like [Labrus mixtus]|uniref:cytosolic phospholipase A2 gamma-like n=1 Tax=Labrus mixtus TaxID=508554 RepID=UPI0029BFBCBD|nr:cytosolic phospholipase A2 gamma-like [Labrus mixtus]
MLRDFEAVASTESNMEEKRTEKSVRQSESLCEGEQKYVLKRKEGVLQSLKILRINCSEDSVPHIAMLGSGGGQRAAVALVGTLYQMGKDGLLDSVLYLAGVSGSTWSMASLYSNPRWSKEMDKAMSSLIGPGVKACEALSWLDERAKEEDFSLTDIWGMLASAKIMKKMDLRLLSAEASRDATNPYPIYCAIEKHCLSEGPVKGTWFEISPHEAGFTDLGLFIETSLLGSKFENGKVQEEIAEMDMVKLKGIFGSALAHEGRIIDYILHWLHGPEDPAATQYKRLYQGFRKVIAVTRNTVKDPAAQSDLDKLHKLLENAYEALLVESESKSLQEMESVFQQGSEQLLAVVECWSQSLVDGGFITHAKFIITRVLPLILKWEWGTTNNFLYQFQNSSVPPCLHTKENLHLVDAGLLVNVPYQSFLGDKRDIDLIIAPEYSAGNMFETLTVARDYAAKLKKPFPKIDEKILEERDWPKDCYVFEGKEKEPTIVFLPLFNRNNCKDAEEVKAKMSEYCTFQGPYSQDKIKLLFETAKENMKRNKETLLREIKNAAERRRCK